MIQPRLSNSEIREAKRAGMLTIPAPKGKKTTIFASFYQVFSAIFSGSPTFWGYGNGSKGPVNAVSSTAGQTVSPASAMNLSTVWACVWLNARTMASLPLELKRYQPNGAGKLAEDDPLFEVLRWRPAADMSAFTFWLAMWASEQLWGAGFAEIKRNGGKIVALNFLLPQYMTTYLTATGAVRYRYDSPFNPADYSQDQIFSLMTRTLDGITGLSVIEFARNSLGLAQSAEQVASMNFKKGLNASGFLEVDKFLTPDQRTMLRTRLDEFTGDGAETGGQMVLEGGLHYKQLAMKPLDAELLASREFSVEDLCRWFGVPPSLIGHAAGGTTMWGSGIESLFRGWLQLGLRPYVTAAPQAVRRSLIEPKDRATLYAEYDLDDLLAADSAARAQLYSTYAQNGIKTRDEIREKEGLGPMPGGDVLTVQSNLVPLDKLGSITPAGSTLPPAEKMRNALLEFLSIDSNPAQKGEGSAP